MKKLFFLMCTLAVCIIVSGCSSSAEEPLIGDFVKFTVSGKDKTTLTGVKNKKNNEVLVTPADFAEIYADSSVIVCEAGDESYVLVHKANGELIGRFDDFEHMPDDPEIEPNECDYYTGSIKDSLVFYFPKVDEIIGAVDLPHAPSNSEIIIPVADGYEIRNLVGELLWKMPQSFTLILDRDKPDMYVIALEGTGKQPDCTIYSNKGDVIKKLTPSQWRRVKRKIEFITPMNEEKQNSPNIAIMEDIKQI